jgi:hypothetical protein
LASLGHSKSFFDLLTNNIFFWRVRSLDLIREAHRRWATAGADSTSTSSSSSRLGAPDAGGDDDNAPSASDRAAAGKVVFPRANPHLFRQLVARGCYSLMLEHFYAAFPSDQVRVVCTENLAPDDAARAAATGGAARVSSGNTATAAATMRSLALWLGLAGGYDFEATVRKGRFNARGKRGYDQLTAWGPEPGEYSGDSSELGPPRPPMPASLRRTLTSFYAPLNERLFELAGARCPWPGLEE